MNISYFYAQARWPGSRRKKICGNAQKILDLCPLEGHNVYNVSSLVSAFVLGHLRLSPPPSSFGVDLARLQRVALFFAGQGRTHPARGRTPNSD